MSNDRTQWRKTYTALFIDRTQTQLDDLASEILKSCGPDTRPDEIETALRRIDTHNDMTHTTRAPRAGNIIREIWNERKGGASRSCSGFSPSQHREHLRDHAAGDRCMFEVLPAKQGDYGDLYATQEARSRQVIWYVDLVKATPDRLKRWDLICAARVALPWMPGVSGCELVQAQCQQHGIEFIEYGPELELFQERVARAGAAMQNLLTKEPQTKPQQPRTESRTTA